MTDGVVRRLTEIHFLREDAIAGMMKGIDCSYYFETISNIHEATHLFIGTELDLAAIKKAAANKCCSRCIISLPEAV